MEIKCQQKRSFCVYQKDNGQTWEMIKGGKSSVFVLSEEMRWMDILPNINQSSLYRSKPVS